MFLPLVNYLIDSLDWRTTAVVIGVVIWAVGYPLALLMRHRPEQYGMKPDGLDEPAPAARRPTTPVPEPDFTPFEALRTRAFWLINLNAASRTFILSALAVNLVVALEGVGLLDRDRGQRPRGDRGCSPFLEGLAPGYWPIGSTSGCWRRGYPY